MPSSTSVVSAGEGGASTVFDAEDTGSKSGSPGMTGTGGTDS